MDIKTLEIEFTKNPKSDIFLELCDAYIESKRFMEAMVVCKKGIKNLPADDLRGRLMLVKIYEAQGKKPKADQEMAALRQEFPNHPMLGGGAAPQAPAPMQQMPMQQPVPGQMPMAAPAANPFAAPSPFEQAAAPAANPFAAPSPFEQAAAPGANPFAAMGSPFDAAAQGNAAASTDPSTNPFAVASPFEKAMQAPAADSPKLESVSDFFSQGALGYADNTIPEGMTAGKGRLTIVGFVPKQSHNFKFTMIVLAAVVVLAGALTTWFYFDSQKQSQITDIYKVARAEVDKDTYKGFKAAIEECEKILALDKKHAQTLATLAFSYASLAKDHNMPGALEKAEEYIGLAEKASSEQFSYGIAAKGLIAFLKKDYDNGIKFLNEQIGKGARNDLIDMELFRLLRETKPNDEDTKKVLVSLNQASGSARIFTFLAEHYYATGDFSKAGSLAGQTQNSNKEHIQGQLFIQLALFPNEFDATGEMDKNLDKIAKIASGENGSIVDKAMLNMTYGMYHLRFLRMEEAKKFFEQVDLKNVPDSLVYMRAKMYNEAKEYELALADIDYLLGKNKSKANYYLVKADALMNTKDFAGSDAALAEAEKLDKDNVLRYYLTAYSLQLQDKKDEAIEAYNKVPNKNADLYILAHNKAAQLMVAKGKKADALKYVEELLHALPPGSMQPQQAKAFTLYGLMFEANGKKDDAGEAYAQAREIFHMYSDVHYYMCRLEKSAKMSCKTYLRLTPWGEFRQDAAKRAGCQLDKLMECFQAN